MARFRRLGFSVIALLLGATGVRAEDERTTIPLTLTQSDYGGGRIYLPVRVGNFMGAMRLDTGASTSRVAVAPWNADLPSLGESSSTGASGRTARCEDVEAKLVALKAAKGPDIAREKYVVTRCAASSGDDLLGLDFFRGARFSLDLDVKTMIFGEAAASSSAQPFRLLGPGRRLVGLEARIGDVAVVGLFDTGAEISAVDRRFVAKHKKLFTLVKAKSGASEAAGRGFSSRIYQIRELDLGEGRVVRDVYALVYDFGVLREALGSDAPVVLGYNFLSRFSWDLDFRAPEAPTWGARARQGK